MFINKIVLLIGITLMLNAAEALPTQVETMAASALKRADVQQYEAYETLKEERDVLVDSSKHAYKMIIYFTSITVPSEHYIQIIKESVRSDLNVTVHPVVRGLDKRLFSSLQGYREALETMTPGMRKRVEAAGGKVRVTPKLFQMLNITKVPAIALAECAQPIPSHQWCDVKVFAVGETTLTRMAEASGTGESARELYSKVWK